MNLALGANREGKESVNGKASRILNRRIGSALVCLRRNARHRQLKLPESTSFALITVVVMVAVSVSGSTGCLVVYSKPSSSLVPKHILTQKTRAVQGDHCNTAHRLLLANNFLNTTLPGAGMDWHGP